MNFLERSLAGFLSAIEHAMEAEELAKTNGLLQRLDPRIKLLGILILVVATATAHRLSVIAAIFAAALVLALTSRISPLLLAKRVWIPVLLFTGVIALPAPLITPGRIVAHLPLLNWPVTAQGLRTAAYLLSRVTTASTLSVLLILSTSWTHVLKALRVLCVPVVVVVVLGMSYRYIFLLIDSARDMLESRRSRMVGRLPGSDRRRLAAASVGVLMSKTMQLSGDVYSAMLSRGFTGEVYLLDDFRAAPLDWLMLLVFASLAGCAFYFGK